MNIASGPAGMTYVAPEIIAAHGRLIAFHTGIDHQVYYSITLRGNNEDRWTNWRSIPGFADTHMGPSATVIDPDGNNIGIFVTRTNGHVAGTQMDVRDPQYPRFGGWTEDAQGVYVTRPDVTSRYNPLNGHTEVMGVATGRDGHGWSILTDRMLSVGLPSAPVFSGNLAQTIRDNAGPRRLDGPSDPVSNGPSIAHAGRADRLSTNPWEPEFELERTVGITILSAEATILWEGRYQGRTAGNWTAHYNSFAPSPDSPQMHAMREAVYAAFTWLNAEDRRFPNHAIVEKRL